MQDTLNSPTFAPHPATGDILDWLSRHGGNSEIKDAARLARQLYRDWVAKKKSKEGKRTTHVIRHGGIGGVAMPPPLHDNIWDRRGITILWDADELNRLCTPQKVVSFRRFLQLHANGWQEADLPLVNDTALIVAGLESCYRLAAAHEAEEWLVSTVYIVSFQQEVSDGGNEAALIFWLVDHERLQYQTSENSYFWHCGTEYHGQQVPLSRCLFNGAQHDLRRIEKCSDTMHPDKGTVRSGLAYFIRGFLDRGNCQPVAARSANSARRIWRWRDRLSIH